MALVKIAIHNSKKSFIFSQKYDKKSGEFIRQNPPKGGWWRVEWSRKPPKGDKGITGYMGKRRAEDFEILLNNLSINNLHSLSTGIARDLINELQSHGREIQSKYELHNPRPSGRCR